jgi:hypothetical protein
MVATTGVVEGFAVPAGAPPVAAAGLFGILAPLWTAELAGELERALVAASESVPVSAARDGFVPARLQAEVEQPPE